LERDEKPSVSTCPPFSCYSGLSKTWLNPQKPAIVKLQGDSS